MRYYFEEGGLFVSKSSFIYPHFTIALSPFRRTNILFMHYDNIYSIPQCSESEL